MPTLDWIGKKSVINHHREVPYRLLKCDKDKSFGDPDSGNLLVQGDNLEALKALLPYYAGKVKCIYIDPPYNTGSEEWIYNDNVNSPEIKAWLGKVVEKEFDDLTRHDKWLCMMYPRLRLLREFLSEDGSIWLSIDDNETHSLKLLCDEIFGRKNFLSQVAYERSGVSGLGQGGSFLVNTHEHLYWYSKDRNLVKVENLNGLRAFTQKEMQRYNRILVDPGRRVEIASFIAPSTNEPVKIYKHENAVIETISLRNFETRKEEILKRYIENFSKVHRLTSIQEENEFQNKILRYCKDGVYSADYLVSRGKREGETITNYYQNEQIVVWLSDTAEIEAGEIVRTSKLSDFWAHGDIPKADLANEGGVDFRRGKKPERLIERLLEISSRKDDLILDSFAGSGTTGAVAHKMGRRHISVEMGDHATTHIVPRYQKVISGDDRSGISESVGWQGGGGFRYCTLGEPLFDADGNIADAVSFSDLAAHVFFCETGAPIQKRAVSTSPFIGTFQGRAIYLLYAKDSAGVASVKKGNVLDGKTLDALPKAKDGNTHRVIYAEGCTLSESRLRKEGVTFKHIPYQIAGA